MAEFDKAFTLKGNEILTSELEKAYILKGNEIINTDGEIVGIISGDTVYGDFNGGGGNIDDYFLSNIKKVPLYEELMYRGRHGLSDGVVDIIGNSNRYTFGESALVYFEADLTNINYVYVITSRSSGSGRMYLMASKDNINDIDDNTYLYNVDGISNYITDTANYSTNRIDVAALSGKYYIALANGSDNITHVHSIYLSDR